MTASRRALLTLLLGTCACAAPQRPAPGPEPALSSAAPTGAPCGGYGVDAPGERGPLEARAWAELRRALPRGTALRASGALDRAARALATATAGAEPGRDPLARERIQDALRTAGAFDPAPTAHLFVGSPDAILSALLARIDPGSATHVGIGDREEAGGHRLVLLLARRRARLDAIPGAVAAGARATLGGELLGLLHPRAWVTRPDGVAEELELHGGRSFSGALTFPLPGRHSVEVVGVGEHGPEVAALLRISAGGAGCATGGGSPVAAEPDDPAAAEQGVVDAVNRTRRAQGLPALASSRELSDVARAHSERMRAAGLVAHVLPADGELVSRLGAARIAYRRALENVASGETTLSAHAAIEASPAHRANLLSPSATLTGVGVARGALPGGERVVYLTEIFVEPTADAADDRLTPDARVREALWRERARRGLPPLTNDAALEALARSAALAMRANDRGEVDGLAEGALRGGRELAAADAFIASDPGEAIRSRNLSDPRFRRVGVGVVLGASPRFGPARLFIAVVYGD